MILEALESLKDCDSGDFVSSFYLELRIQYFVFSSYKKSGRRKMETETLFSLSLSLLLEYQKHSDKVSDMVVFLSHRNTCTHTCTTSPVSIIQIYDSLIFRIKFLGTLSLTQMHSHIQW